MIGNKNVAIMFVYYLDN